jgi:hypothetical protein
MEKYIPNNYIIYTAAYAGALSGIKVFNKSPSIYYTNPCAIAGSYARKFDTLFNPIHPNILQTCIVQEASFSLFANRSLNSTNPDDFININ